MNDYYRYAELLCDYCLGLQEGQKLFVNSTPLATPLLQEIQLYCAMRGIHVEFSLSFENQKKLLITHGTDEVLRSANSFYGAASRTFDCFLSIDAPYKLDDLQDVPVDKLKLFRTHMSRSKDRILKRESQGNARWCLCIFPTEAYAQEAGMDLESYTKFVLNACFIQEDYPYLSWKKLSQEQEKIVSVLNRKKRFRYVGPETDISFSTEGRSWINSDGKRNMPSGEVYTSPVTDSVQGHVFFSIPSRYQGQVVSGIRLTVNKGYVESWSAEEGQEALDQAFSIPGSRYFGEAAIGTNPFITEPTGNILFDEKIKGTVHMALGSSYPSAGGTHRSALHWDLITDMTQGGQIYADGELIYENGEFLSEVFD